MKTVLATLAILVGMAGAPCSCGGDTIPPVDAAADAAADATSTTCYEPSNPLRAYACGLEADCSSCPTSCDVDGFDAGAGVCK